jgi:hypothetical protein
LRRFRIVSHHFKIGKYVFRIVDTPNCQPGQAPHDVMVIQDASRGGLGCHGVVGKAAGSQAEWTGG